MVTETFLIVRVEEGVWVRINQSLTEGQVRFIHPYITSDWRILSYPAPLPDDWYGRSGLEEMPIHMGLLEWEDARDALLTDAVLQDVIDTTTSDIYYWLTDQE